MKKTMLIAFTMFNFFDFQANAGHHPIQKITQDDINEIVKSPFNVFKRQNKDIAHSENLSPEEKMDVLNAFFAAIEISEEDKEYLKKEMLDGDFSLNTNLNIINDFEVIRLPLSRRGHHHVNPLGNHRIRRHPTTSLQHTESMTSRYELGYIRMDNIEQYISE